MNTKTETTKNASWKKAEHWDRLVDQTAVASRLTPGEKEKLAGSLPGEIIAATAYLSGCHNPGRTAVVHLTTFMASLRCREVFDHAPGENLESRLLPIAYYPEGDPDYIQAGLLLLQLISLNDHRHDLAGDILTGKQNPLITELHYDQEKTTLLSRWENLPSTVRESYQAYYNKAISAVFWI